MYGGKTTDAEALNLSALIKLLGCCAKQLLQELCWSHLQHTVPFSHSHSIADIKKHHTIKADTDTVNSLACIIRQSAESMKFIYLKPILSPPYQVATQLPCFLTHRRSQERQHWQLEARIFYLKPITIVFKAKLF